MSTVLNISVLCLNTFIVQTKSDDYRLMQAARDQDAWEDWVLYIVRTEEEAASHTLVTVNAIKAALLDYKHRIRAGYKFYSQDLINNMFMHHYTKVTVRSVPS